MEDRDRDIDVLELRRENRELYQEWLREKLGKRAKRMMPEPEQQAETQLEEFAPEEGFYGG